MISNGGFETNTGANAGNATGWTKDNGAYGVFNELLYGRNGAHAGSWAYVPGNGPSTTAGAYQTLASPLVAGQQYTLSFYQNPWAASNGNDVRVGKYNSGSRDSDGSYSPLPLSAKSVSTVAAGNWELKSYTFTAVGGEDTVYFGTAIAGGEGADIDDVSLTLGGGGQTGIGDDPDGDGNDNGVENFFGTAPDTFTQGLVSGEVDTGANTFTFTHPLNATPADDLTATYRWSTDLQTFYNDGDPNGAGTTTVTFVQGTPSGGMVTVTATISGTVIPDKLFVDVEVTQN